jgi:glycosyltransferase involved in cell wall biosynthesis
MLKPYARRVLVLAPQPFYQDRGTPIALLHVLSALSQRGIGADVLTFPGGVDVDLPGIRLLRVKNRFGFRHVPIGFSIRKLLLDVELALELRRLLRHSASEYIGIHALEESAFLAVLLGRRSGLPVVYDMQSSLPEQLQSRWQFRLPPIQQAMRACERWLLNRVQLVVCSAGLLNRVRSTAPSAKVREWWFPVRFGPNSPEVARALRQELKIPGSAPVVVYSGTFEAYQGLPDLLRAIPLVRQQVPGVVFVLVGRNGPSGDPVVQVANELGLLGNGVLHLVPRQPRASIAGYLAMADVLVSPRSACGNMPLKIYEYLASGRPIVATDLPVHRPALEPDRAVLVPPTPEQLATGIVSVLRDATGAATLARAAQAYAREHLGEDMFVRWIDALYRELSALARNGKH